MKLKCKFRILCPDSKDSIGYKLVSKCGLKACGVFQFEKSNDVIEGSQWKGYVKLIEEVVNVFPKVLNTRAFP